MIAYHATPVRNVPSILTVGLRPDLTTGNGATNIRGVYFLADPDAALGFITGIYPGERIVVLAVELAGLPTTLGDDDDDIVVQQRVEPHRIRQVIA